MKLSIIIPAYNVEQYLERCITSCERQDIPQEEYEVIVVDDGSKDNTLQVAHRLAEKYDNVTVLAQENQGQSVARNKGIEIAKGEYLWFVDSDDYIDENCIGNLLAKADENRLDILMFSMKVSVTGNNLKRQLAWQIQSSDRVYLQGEILMAGFSVGSICSVLFRRDFIMEKNLRFTPNLIHQDAEFSYRTLALAARCMYVDFNPYNYFIHEGSVLTNTNVRKTVKREVDNVRIAKMLYDFANEQRNNGINDQLADFLVRRSRSIHFGSVMSLWAKRKEWQKNGTNAMIIEQLKDLNLFPLCAPYNSWKHRFFATFILNNSWLYC